MSSNSPFATRTTTITFLPEPAHHLYITRILRTDIPYHILRRNSTNTTTASADALSSFHPKGSATDHRDVIVPFDGKLVEVLVDVGNAMRVDDVICIVRKMKMELEVRATRRGIVE